MAKLVFWLISSYKIGGIAKLLKFFVSVTFMREILRELKKKIPQKPSLGPQKVELKYLVFFCAIPSSSQHEKYCHNYVNDFFSIPELYKHTVIILNGFMSSDVHGNFIIFKDFLSYRFKLNFSSPSCGNITKTLWCRRLNRSNLKKNTQCISLKVKVWSK